MSFVAGSPATHLFVDVLLLLIIQAQVRIPDYSG
jgi:hypothetical protein